MSLADKYGIYVVEDAAQAIDSYYNGKPLGGIGHLAAFSFHETKKRKNKQDPRENLTPSRPNTMRGDIAFLEGVLNPLLGDMA